jgi:hypothetical protein
VNCAIGARGRSSQWRASSGADWLRCGRLPASAGCCCWLLAAGCWLLLMLLLLLLLLLLVSLDLQLAAGAVAGWHCGAPSSANARSYRMTDRSGQRSTLLLGSTQMR